MAASAEVINAPQQPESASTLRTIVELVRRIMRADVTSIVTFSLTDKTITWKAASGFREHLIDDSHPLVRPITNQIAQRALTTDLVMTFEGIGSETDLPAGEFPVHTAEGIRDMAMTPLKARGQTLGALIIGHRMPHQFTAAEKELLQDLAAMAALALENVHLLETVSAAEKIWAQTFDAIGEGIIVHDSEMLVVRCNAMAAEMMNLQPAEVIGLSFRDAFGRLFGKRAAEYYLAESRGLSSAFEVQT